MASLTENQFDLVDLILLFMIHKLGKSNLEEKGIYTKKDVSSLMNFFFKFLF